jgi:hypothetical protein
MRSFRLPAIGLLAAALAVPAVASPALAATPTPIPTAIVNFAVTPSAISVGNTQVTLSGRLVESADPSVGVPNEPLSWYFIIAAAGTPEIGLGSTGPDGTFTIQYTTTVGGIFGVQFTGDSATGYAASPVVSTDVRADSDPTSITLNAQPTSLVGAGSVLTFTGMAEAETADGMQPLADVFIRILRNGVDTGYGGWTAADGTFAATVTAYSGGAWQAVYDPGWPQAYTVYQQSRSNSVQVNVQYKTRTDFSVPARQEAHATFTVSGHVQGWNGNGFWFGAGGVLVNFYYRVLPAGGWVKAGAARTDASGTFRGTAKVRPGYLRWQVQVPRQSPGDVYLPSASGTHDNFITDQTCTSIGVRNSGGRTIVSGIVRDSCGSKTQTFGAVKGAVKVYYHPRGTTTWRYLSQVSMGSGGTFSYSRGVLHGYFVVVFPAQGYYLASKSNVAYVS